MPTLPTLEDKSVPEIRPTPAALPPASEQKQRRQMFVALALLLIALVLVIVKDREFWFPSPVAETEAPEQSAGAKTAETKLPPVQMASSTTPALPHAKPKSHSKPVPPPAGAAPSSEPVVTNRAVLPPLEIEVVAGDTHRTVQSKNPALKVDMQPGVPATAASEEPSEATDSTGGIADASQRVRLSPDTEKAVMTRPVQPNYPMLAKQMKVQGSVVLQALIAKDGGIQDLRVLSGPAILSSAALEAVRQWRFKPYYQSGVAVETEARITVNFTISTY